MNNKIPRLNPSLKIFTGILVMMFINTLSAQVLGPIDTHTYTGMNGSNHDVKIYYPQNHTASDSAPCVLFFHAGSWVSGDLNQFIRQCEYFASRGMVAMTANYSMHTPESEALLPVDESIKRICVMDAKSIIRWIKTNADQMGINPDQLILGGASAGGHISVLSIMDERYNNPADDLSIDMSVQGYMLYCPAFTQYTKDARPDMNVFQHIDKAISPITFFVGETDGWKPASDALVEEFISRGNNVTVWMGPTVGHMFHRDDPWVDLTMIKADEFLQSLGILNGNHTVTPPSGSETLIDVTPAPGSLNPSPVLSFNTPDLYTKLNLGSGLTVDVAATDADGIQRVYLYKDGIQLARSEGGAPYEWGAAGQNDPELQNLQIGTYTLTAWAIDNAGKEGSATVTVTVTDPASNGAGFGYGSFTSNYGVTLPYRLFVPDDYNPTVQYPIVLAIHGLGRRGSDNEKQMDIMITKEWATPEVQAVSKCFILAPQLPDGEVWVTPGPGGYNGSYTRDDQTTTVFLRTVWEMFDSVIGDYSIDLKRQYIAGHSSGGYATWDTIYNFPNRFAAALPSAGGGDPATAANLVGMPIWAVHGDSDAIVPPSGSTDMINAIRAAGGTSDVARMTIYPGVEHEAQVPAMSDINIPTWILSQVNNRNDSVSTTPAVNLHGLFTSGMIFQRNENVAVYGTANVGEVVTVNFAGQSKVDTTDGFGNWKVHLDPMSASSTGRTMTVTSDLGGSISLSNILVGDVWIVSGQSNMDRWFQAYVIAEQDIVGVSNNQIRIFRSDNSRGSIVPETEVTVFSSFNNSWQIAEENYLRVFSPAGYYMADRLQKELNIPIGVIQAGLGATNIESWLPTWLVESTQEYEYMIGDQWRWNVMSQEEIDGGHEMARRGSSGLYNHVVAPLRGFTFKGFAWCQGESSSKRPWIYRRQMPDMISAWRQDFNVPNAPFLVVEIAPYGGYNTERAPWLREAQAEALTLPNTGFVTTVDIGEYVDIHPQDKKSVGDRLAYLALDMDGLSYNGHPPTYKSMSVVGSSIEVDFHKAAALSTHEVRMNHDRDLPIGQDPNAYVVPAGTVRGFEICESNQVFVEANAVISGNKVIVSAPGVNNPVAVRYAWKNFPLANLISGDGRVVPPFRTDDFIGPYHPPVFITDNLNTVVDRDVFFGADMSAIDPTGDPLSYAIAGYSGPAANWLSIDPNTGIITGTPTVEGSYTWVVSVRDTAFGDSDSFNVVYANVSIEVGPPGPLKPAGLIDRTDESNAIVSTEHSGSPVGQEASKAFDNDLNTKFLTNNGSAWVQHQFASDKQYTVEWYSVTSAADVPTVVTGNLIENGSFENGAEDWSLSAAASVSTTISHGGSNSLKITSTGSSGSTSQGVTLVPGVDYNVSVWVLGSGITAGNAIFDTLDKFDAAGQSQFVVSSGEASVWTEYTGSFNSGNENAVTFRMFTNSTFSGTVYYDDITVTALNMPVAPAHTMDPSSWTLSGSNDGSIWTTIDSRSGVFFPGRGAKLEFSALSNTTAYEYYRFDAESLGGNILQYAEVELFSDSSEAGIQKPVGLVDRTDDAGAVYSSQYNDSPAGQEVDKLFDNDVNTKYLTANSSAWLQHRFGGNNAYTVQWYTISSAVDSPSAPAQPNLLTNSSFESGGAASTDWILSGTGLATGSTDTAHDGSSSLKLSTATPIQITPTRQVINNIEPNTDYNLSVWVQNAGQSAGNLVIDFNDKPTPQTELQFLVGPGAANNWTEYNGVWNSGSETSATLRLFTSGTFSGTAYIDHISLSKVPGQLSAEPLDPASWILSGSNDGSSWDTLDTQSGVNFSARGQTREFALLSNSTAYEYYRFDFSNDGGTYLQLAEIELWADANEGSSDIEVWQALHSITDLSADSDGDGVINLAEFALGGDPNAQDGDMLNPLVVDNGSNFEFSFNRAEESVVYTVEKSTNLSAWTDYVTDPGNFGGVVTVSVPDTEMSNGKLFLRLKVEN